MRAVVSLLPLMFVALLLGYSSAVYAEETAPEADVLEETFNIEASAARMQASTKAETAREVVEIATEEVLALIKSAQGYAEEDPDRFYREAELLMRSVVDFRRFARAVMGPWYKKATPEQRERFAESFKWTLVRTYALALTEFRDGKVEILDNKRPSTKPDQATVRQQITYRDKPYSVVYAMLRRNGEWGLANVVIEGLNVRLNYRSQFNSAMKDKRYGRDIDQVITAWSNVITAENE